ncbi:hypothetical protein AOZ07_15670 [Glutamicibacter halophytocola]|nr:hypothetical protein AOZ07_15670 [Glutamicibacter halophytocola]
MIAENIAFKNYPVGFRPILKTVRVLIAHTVSLKFKRLHVLRPCHRVKRWVDNLPIANQLTIFNWSFDELCIARVMVVFMRRVQLIRNPESAILHESRRNSDSPAKPTLGISFSAPLHWILRGRHVLGDNPAFAWKIDNNELVADFEFHFFF